MGAPLMELGSNVLQSGATAAKAAALPAAGMVAQEPKKVERSGLKMGLVNSSMIYQLMLKT